MPSTIGHKRSTMLAATKSPKASNRDDDAKNAVHAGNSSDGGGGGGDGRGAKIQRTDGVPWTEQDSNGQSAAAATGAASSSLPSTRPSPRPTKSILKKSKPVSAPVSAPVASASAPLTQAQILALHEKAAEIAAADMARSSASASSNNNNDRAAYNKMRADAAAAATPKVPFYADTPPPANSGSIGGVRDRSASNSTDPTSRDQGGRFASNDSTWSALDTPSPSQRNNGSNYLGMEEEGHDSSMTATPVQFRRASSSATLGFVSWKVGRRYQLLRVLGHGSYGEVAQATDKLTGDKVAIKRINNVFDQEIDTKRILREVYILRRLKNPHVIRLINVVTPEKVDFNEIYLVFEFVDTDLHKLINSPQYLTVDHIKTFLYQLLCALKYVHSAMVIHRDIKPANILLNEDCGLKVCDFGLARVIGSHVHSGDVHEGTNDDVGEPNPNNENRTSPTTKTLLKRNTVAPSPAAAPTPHKLTRQLTKHVVTRWYRPPELILLQEYSNGVDVWSVGCIFAELLGMQKQTVESYRDRQPLFPGKSCFPLSADNDRTYKDQLDQLNVIFDVIGTPMEEDVAHLGDVQHYLRGLPKKAPIIFEAKYRGAPPEALDLLRKILVFNPLKRISVEDALAHPFLRSVSTGHQQAVSDAGLEMVEGLLSLDASQLKEKLHSEVAAFAAENEAIFAATVSNNNNDNMSSNNNNTDRASATPTAADRANGMSRNRTTAAAASTPSAVAAAHAITPTHDAASSLETPTA